MPLRLAAVAIAVALVTAGCGGNSKHQAVTTYINRVNNTERALAVPFAAVSQANESFAGKKKDPHVDADLAKAEVTMRRLETNIANVPAPPEARHLRALLLELLGDEVALTKEVHALATFMPQFESALHPLPAVSASLKKALGQTAKGDAATKALDAQKASELEAYAGTLDGVIANLRLLEPPAMWKPGYDTQLVSLVELRATALALAQAIHRSDATAIPGLLRRFDAAASADQTVAAQKRQIAAVKAYDNKIKEIVLVARQVQSERGRLQRVYE